MDLELTQETFTIQSHRICSQTISKTLSIGHFTKTKETWASKRYARKTRKQVTTHTHQNVHISSTKRLRTSRHQNPTILVLNTTTETKKNSNKQIHSPNIDPETKGKQTNINKTIFLSSLSRSADCFLSLLLLFLWCCVAAVVFLSVVSLQTHVCFANFDSYVVVEWDSVWFANLVFLCVCLCHYLSFSWSFSLTLICSLSLLSNFSMTFLSLFLSVFYSLCQCLAFYLSIYLSIYLYIYIYISLSLCLSVSLSLSLSLSLSVSLSLSLSLSRSLSLSLSLSRSLSL